MFADEEVMLIVDGDAMTMDIDIDMVDRDDLKQCRMLKM